MSLKFQPKYDKIVELLLYLAHKRPNADHYQAVKFLYLADKEHLNRYGRPITFEKYAAMPYGPVASNAYDLLKNPKKNFAKFNITELPFERLELDRMVFIGKPLRSVDHDVFSKTDLAVFNEIITKYGTCSFKDLYDLTHEHFAYRHAWDHIRSPEKKSVVMRYEDMLDEFPEKQSYLEEITPISEHMQ